MLREAFLVCLILLGSALTSSHSTHTHKCIHDELAKENPVEIAQDHPIGPQLHSSHFQFNNGQAHRKFMNQFVTVHKQTKEEAVDGWHQLRIYLDFSYANDFVAANPTVQSKYMMAARILQDTRKYFQDSLVVNYFTEMNFLGGTCKKLAIEAFKKPIDLYIVVAPENNIYLTYYASATGCYLSSRDKRPIISAYTLNFAPMTVSALSNLFLFSTFAHELTHILGFSASLYQYFLDTNYADSANPVSLGSAESKKANYQVQVDLPVSGGLSKETFSLLTLTELVSYAREYYGCPTLVGVPLENNGTSATIGSHWEKLFLPTEYMNPTVENPGIISEFTFALLRSSGWYKTKIGAAQYYDWGKGEGCEFFKVCPQTKNKAYCLEAEKGQQVCASEYLSKSKCNVDKLFSSSKCPMRTPLMQVCTMEPGPTIYKEQFEEFGPGARCFLWKEKYWNGLVVNKPKCHFAYCQDNIIYIKHGKDVNFRSKLTFVDWREGYTPLHWAAAQRDAFA